MTKKVEEEKKDTKKVLEKNTKVADTKVDEKTAKKVLDKNTKVNKKASKKEKKSGKKGNIFTRIFNYFKDVRNEMIKVRWPSKKEMLLYSGATLSFIVVFALFFMLNDVVISALKQLVR